jgi:hypothetical protein
MKAFTTAQHGSSLEPKVRVSSSSTQDLFSLKQILILSSGLYTSAFQVAFLFKICDLNSVCLIPTNDVISLVHLILLNSIMTTISEKYKI